MSLSLRDVIDKAIELGADTVHVEIDLVDPDGFRYAISKGFGVRTPSMVRTPSIMTSVPFIVFEKIK